MSSTPAAVVATEDDSFRSFFFFNNTGSTSRNTLRFDEPDFDFKPHEEAVTNEIGKPIFVDLWLIGNHGLREQLNTNRKRKMEMRMKTKTSTEKGEKTNKLLVSPPIVDIDFICAVLMIHRDTNVLVNSC